jgi:hypothetical protein
MRKSAIGSSFSEKLVLFSSVWERDIHLLLRACKEENFAKWHEFVEGKIRHTPAVPKYLSLYASRETILFKYILKNINIYGI